MNKPIALHDHMAKYKYHMNYTTLQHEYWKDGTLQAVWHSKVYGREDIRNFIDRELIKDLSSIYNELFDAYNELLIEYENISESL